MRKLIFASVIGALVLLPLAALADSHQDLYAKKCASCHGKDGSGNAAIAKMMKVELSPLGGEEVQGMSDEELRTIILEGKGKMKPTKGVTPEQADEIVKAVRDLAG